MRHQNHKIASAPLLPKFVSEVAAMYHELRKRGTSAADLKFLPLLRRARCRNFKSTTLNTEAADRIVNSRIVGITTTVVSIAGSTLTVHRQHPTLGRIPATAVTTLLLTRRSLPALRTVSLGLKRMKTARLFRALLVTDLKYPGDTGGCDPWRLN
jgi:hypothetical protein